MTTICCGGPRPFTEFSSAAVSTPLFPAPWGKLHSNGSLDDEQSEPDKDISFAVTGGFQAKPGDVAVNNPLGPLGTFPLFTSECSGPATDDNMEYDWMNLPN